MKTFRKLSLAFAATIIIAVDANAGRWLSRDPITEGAGLVQRDPTPEIRITLAKPHHEPNLFAFILNSPQNWIDADGREAMGVNGQVAAVADAGEPTNAECSKFAWWNKIVGVTFASDCKPQLTQWGRQMPKFLQDCVLRHEGVHAKLCKDAGTLCYWMAMMGRRGQACGEHMAYGESVKCAKEAMDKISTFSPEDQLALKCYLATSKQSCKANKTECDKGGRLPGAPSCD